jgi:hypothetical protein
MVVKIISEAIELQDDTPREGLTKRIIRMIRKRAMLFGAILFFGAGIAFAISTVYPGTKPVLPKRARVSVRPVKPAPEKIVMSAAKTREVDRPVEKADKAIQVDKPIEKVDSVAQVDKGVQPVDNLVQKIETDTPERLQTVNDQLGGLPSTDRAPVASAEQPRPWVLHGDGIGTLDSRNPEMSKATEIYVGTDLSDAQVNKLANKIDEQVAPKLSELVARVDSRLEEKMAEIAARHALTAEELSSLKTELTRSLNVTLREEIARNQELWQNNATYRVLYHRSVDLNQDLIGLYAGKTKDDHAIGNILKVVPKLFTLQVWQNRDSDDQYLRLLARYEELQSDSRQISVGEQPQQQQQQQQQEP